MLDFGFYNMDCFDGMKQFPDKYFDLAIVDPPYGINATKFNNGNGLKDHSPKDSTAVKARKGRLNQGSGKLKTRALNTLSCDWDFEPPKQEYFSELFRVSRNQIIWGGKLYDIQNNQWNTVWFATNKRNYRMGQNATVGKLFAV